MPGNKNNATIYFEGKAKRRVFIQAVSKGDAATVKALLNQDVDVKCDGTLSALMIAKIQEHAEIVELLKQAVATEGMPVDLVQL